MSGNIGLRPHPADRGDYPISILKASSNPLGCPVFGEQIDRKWTTCLGWTVEELMSKPLLNFVHPDDFFFSLLTRLASCQ